MKWKRYQYWSNEGIKWTRWFKTTNKDTEKWQMKGKLRNEFSDHNPDEDSKS